MAHYGDHSFSSSRKRPAGDDFYETPRFKRSRYSDPGPRGRDREPESAEQKLESLILRVGEKSHKSLESNLEALSDILHREVLNLKDEILQIICKCVSSLPEKTTIYSTLIGLLNAKKYDFGEELIDMIVEELKSTLVLKQFEKAKQLVRFLADLVNSKVVAVSSILNLFDSFVTVTYEPDIPQVRSDWYVYVVLSALPWIGSELQDKKGSELDRLFTALDSYMSKRTTPYLPAFQVWTSDHPHPQRDYLELLWSQVKTMKENVWKEHVLVRPYIAFNSEIGGAYAHPLPNIPIPPHTDDSIYPLPSATFRLFSNDDLDYAPQGGRLPPAEAIDRYLLEESVHCIVRSHDSNRKECATALMGFAEKLMKMRLPGEYIITEVLFGYILQLPSPPRVLVCYSSIFIELCKSNPAVFPQLLSQTVELLFTRLDKMNSVCINRLARWFAHHLSNFKFQWEWSKWSSCFQTSPDHPCVTFLCELFSRCIRIHCYDEFAEQVPEDFHSLFPPEPVPQFKFDPKAESVLAETEVATQLLKSIRDKSSLISMEKILDTLPTANPQLVGEALENAKVSVLTHCVLQVGSKTISHCFLALHKFRQLLVDLTTSEETRMTCLKAVGEFYASNAQLHTLVVDKLVRMQIVDAMSVVQWIFSQDVTPFFTRQYVWDILDSTVQKSNRAYHQSMKEMADTEEKLKKVSDLDEVAMGSEERQELERKIEDLKEKVEDCEKTQKDIFVTICQKLVTVLTEHLAHCDQEGIDYETAWFVSTLDNCRQLLVQNFGEVLKYSTTLDTLIFTPDVDSRILEVFQQFQALL